MKIVPNYYLLILIILFISCEGKQYRNVTCNKDMAIKTILELPETKKQAKYIDSISNHKKGISIIIDSLEIEKNFYYELKTGYNGELHWETYSIYYINHKDCTQILVNDIITGDFISINNWRNKKKQKNMGNSSNNIVFSDLFNEGTIINFTPKDLDKKDEKIQSFKKS